MVGQVLSDLPFHVIDRKQGVAVVTYQAGRNPDMPEQSLFLPPADEGVLARSALVVFLFIGEQADLGLGGLGFEGGDLIEQSEKGALDPPGVGFEPGFQVSAFEFLGRGHPAFASEGDIVGKVDELGVFSDQKVDVVGEVLGHAEAFQAVGAQVFGTKGKGFKGLVDEQGVTAETIDAVLDGGGGDIEVTGHVADPAFGFELVEQAVVVDFLFGIVVDVEGLGGELFPAEFALESLDPSEGVGGIGADFDEPVGGGVGAEAEGTVGIGTEARFFHKRSLVWCSPVMNNFCQKPLE